MSLNTGHNDNAVMNSNQGCGIFNDFDDFNASIVANENNREETIYPDIEIESGNQYQENNYVDSGQILLNDDSNLVVNVNSELPGYSQVYVINNENYHNFMDGTTFNNQTTNFDGAIDYNAFSNNSISLVLMEGDEKDVANYSINDSYSSLNMANTTHHKIGTNMASIANKTAKIKKPQFFKTKKESHMKDIDARIFLQGCHTKKRSKLDSIINNTNTKKLFSINNFDINSYFFEKAKIYSLKHLKFKFKRLIKEEKNCFRKAHNLLKKLEGHTYVYKNPSVKYLMNFFEPNISMNLLSDDYLCEVLKINNIKDHIQEIVQNFDIQEKERKRKVRSKKLGGYNKKSSDSDTKNEILSRIFYRDILKNTEKADINVIYESEDKCSLGIIEQEIDAPLDEPILDIKINLKIPEDIEESLPLFNLKKRVEKLKMMNNDKVNSDINQLSINSTFIQDFVIDSNNNIHRDGDLDQSLDIMKDPRIVLPSDIEQGTVPRDEIMPLVCAAVDCGKLPEMGSAYCSQQCIVRHANRAISELKKTKLLSKENKYKDLDGSTKQTASFPNIPVDLTTAVDMSIDNTIDSIVRRHELPRSLANIPIQDNHPSKINDQKMKDMANQWVDADPGNKNSTHSKESGTVGISHSSKIRNITSTSSAKSPPTSTLSHNSTRAINDSTKDKSKVTAKKVTETTQNVDRVKKRKRKLSTILPNTNNALEFPPSAPISVKRKPLAFTLNSVARANPEPNLKTLPPQTKHDMKDPLPTPKPQGNSSNLSLLEESHLSKKVCKHLTEILTDRVKTMSGGGKRTEPLTSTIYKKVELIVEQIEAAMRSTSNTSGPSDTSNPSSSSSSSDTKYKAKYRALVYNLKDPKNKIYTKLITGEVDPVSLVKMNQEEISFYRSGASKSAFRTQNNMKKPFSSSTTISAHGTFKSQTESSVPSRLNATPVRSMTSFSSNYVPTTSTSYTTTNGTNPPKTGLPSYHTSIPSYQTGNTTLKAAADDLVSRSPNHGIPQDPRLKNRQLLPNHSLSKEMSQRKHYDWKGSISFEDLVPTHPNVSKLCEVKGTVISSSNRQQPSSTVEENHESETSYKHIVKSFPKIFRCKSRILPEIVLGKSTQRRSALFTCESTHPNSDSYKILFDYLFTNKRYATFDDINYLQDNNMAQAEFYIIPYTSDTELWSAFETLYPKDIKGRIPNDSLVGVLIYGPVKSTSVCSSPRDSTPFIPPTSSTSTSYVTKSHKDINISDSLLPFPPDPNKRSPRDVFAPPSANDDIFGFLGNLLSPKLPFGDTDYRILPIPGLHTENILEMFDVDAAVKEDNNRVIDTDDSHDLSVASEPSSTNSNESAKTFSTTPSLTNFDELLSKAAISLRTIEQRQHGVRDQSKTINDTNIASEPIHNDNTGISPLENLLSILKSTKKK